MLTGMGWLKKKKNAEVSSIGKNEVKMPCCGVSDVDNLLVDCYLKQTRAGGGGGQSIHVITREHFEKEFRYLTSTQKDVVQAVQ